MSELASTQAHDAEFKLASALVQDGVTRVTVVVPRAPGVLVRARVVAQMAGAQASAGRISSGSITIRFSSSTARPAPSAPLDEPFSRRLAALGQWLRTRAFGRRAAAG
jgi:hypothetical protein